MLAVHYPTKKALKSAIGQRLNYVETSLFGPEYKDNGTFAVVGPDAYNRKWYARIEMKNGLILSVS